jgi:hypothetical protein
VLLGAVGVAAAPALPVPAGGRLGFRLIRHGDVIGSHTVTFQPQGDALAVHVAVDAVVTLLSVPIVRYRHRVTEDWQDGMLVGLASETDKNGDREWAQAHRTSAGLQVAGSKTRPYTAPAAALGTTYWNRRMLDGPMISLEDGVLLRPEVAHLGAELVPTAAGQPIRADRYRLSGAFAVDVWYEPDGTWASLGFSVADGSTIRYERL